MATKWQSRPRRRKAAPSSVLAISISALVLITGIITAFGVHRSVNNSSARARTESESSLNDSSTSLLLADIAGANARKPDANPPAPTNPRTGTKPPTPTPTPGTELQTPGDMPKDNPSSTVPPPSAPPAEPFTVSGPEAISLHSNESQPVGFTLAGASTADWSGSGPDQNEIEANFTSVSGSSYTVTFTALENAMPGTEVAFTVYATDPETGIKTEKTIIVTIVE